jgi:hypothetical protein
MKHPVVCGRWLEVRWRLAASLGLALALTAASSRADMPTISGALTVAPDLAHHIGRDDRLILKLYYPKDGVEMDATYRIVRSFSLPFDFHVAPSIDMNARTKYDAYVLELFTDKNGDVLAIAPGELIARTPGPVPLGTTDLRLELNAVRE